jgi:hypothetical protein
MGFAEDLGTLLGTAEKKASEWLAQRQAVAIGRLGDVDAIAAKRQDDQYVPSARTRCRDRARRRRDQAGEGSHNAKPAVIVGIQKQPAVNTLELTERIEATLDDIQRALPAGMQIHRDLFRQVDFIQQSRSNLFTAFTEGAVLVIVVVLVFLMNVRAAVITLLALPLSLVAAIIAMDRFGLRINTMSLGGLAIAIGELVDDAIIDVENVVRRLRENVARPGAERLPVLEVVDRASSEMRHSVLPNSRLIASGTEPKLTHRFKAAYARWLERALAHWRPVLTAAAALLSRPWPASFQLAVIPA